MDKNRCKIIMIDDNITNLTVAKNTLSGKYDVYTAPSGKKLFVLLEKLTPDLILLDIEMPEMSGYEVIEVLKNDKKTAGIPVIFLTADIDPKSEIQGLNLGAIDYITKPFSQELLLKRIELHLLVESQRKELQNYNLNLEGMVEKKTKTVFELQSAILKTVAELVESRDNVTGGHIERTQSYLGKFVNFLLENNVYTGELSSWDINLFVMSSQLHDVGKISIKDNILMKPGKLTVEEFDEMKKHTVYGRDIIEKIEASTPESAFLKHAKVLAGSHHEKWDGSGYPFGLKGEDIPLEGRLMAIIDVYDALTNDRPYKKAFTHKDSIEIIRSGKGTHFDPYLTEIFLLYDKEFLNTAESGENTYLEDSGNVSWKSVSQAVAAIVDARDSSENRQAGRIRRYLTILIKALLKDERYTGEVSSWDLNIFFLSAQLHDVGKIAVHDNILHKTGNLTEAEYNDAKTHTELGVKVIRQMTKDEDESSLLHHAEVLAGSHHEKWDGSGYPSGLKGTEIPLQGRLMAIIDVYDALTGDRPNRKRVTHQEAVETIKSYSGTYFDPDLVTIFLEHETEFCGGQYGQ